jgi:hypothetical protein
MKNYLNVRRKESNMQKVTLDLVERAAWTFAQAFLSTFVVLAPGIWAAPNLNNAKAAAIAAVTGAMAAGVSALKTFVKNSL